MRITAIVLSLILACLSPVWAAVAEVQVSASVATSSPTGSTLSGTVNGTLPSAASSSDDVFLFVYFQCNGTTSPAFATPSGWNLAATYTETISYSPQLVAVYWRTGFTGTSQAVAWTLGANPSGASLTATMLEVSGASTTAPVDANSSLTVSNANISGVQSLNQQNLAPAKSNSLLISGSWLPDDLGAVSSPAPSGFTSLISGPGSAGFYGNTALIKYNSTPSVGTPVQTGLVINGYSGGVSDYAVIQYDLFIDPPGSVTSPKTLFPGVFRQAMQGDPTFELLLKLV